MFLERQWWIWLYFLRKLYFLQNLLKISNCLVQRGKTPLQKPFANEPVFAVRMFFQAQECLYVQAGLPWRCGTWGGKPTPELEMSSAWGTDYGKYNSPRSSRREAERNVLIQRGRAPFQGACLGFQWDSLLDYAPDGLLALLRKLVPILCVCTGPQVPSGLVS